MDILDDLEMYGDVDVGLINDVDALNRQQEYNVRPRKNHFDEWNETEFFNRFRLSKQTVTFLLNHLEPALQNRTERNQDRALKPMDKLLLTLRFLATGDFYICIGDFTGVHKTTASRIIKMGIIALCNMLPEIVNLPDTEEDQQQAKRNFFKISHFPRVIGAIDCTHVKIVSPGGENAEIYRNRKGYFSLNCQVVGSADLKIINLVSRWPGSTHDSHIFENSSVKMKLANGEMGNGVLLGDQGYSLKKYLLTPLGDPQNEVERMYNEAQIRTRNTVERLFGIWKRRFPILSNGIRCNINMAKRIIVACGVLHNIAIDQREENFEENEYVPEHQEVNVHVGMNEGVDDRRPFLDYFQNLLNGRN